MNITINQAQGNVPVTIIALEGDLDGSNFQDVIAKAKEVYNEGARYLLIDMTNVRFMSSAGLVALHSIALLLRGDTPPDPEAGWNALHAVSHDKDTGIQRHIKLLSPQQRVELVLEKTGLKTYFEIHNALDTAVASF
jgi:anti-anti-sigma regulatory factor